MSGEASTHLYVLYLQTRCTVTLATALGQMPTGWSTTVALLAVCRRVCDALLRDTTSPVCSPWHSTQNGASSTDTSHVTLGWWRSGLASSVDTSHATLGWCVSGLASSVDTPYASVLGWCVSGLTSSIGMSHILCGSGLTCLQSVASGMVSVGLYFRFLIRCMLYSLSVVSVLITTSSASFRSLCPSCLCDIPCASSMTLITSLSVPSSVPSCFCLKSHASSMTLITSPSVPSSITASRWGHVSPTCCSSISTRWTASRDVPPSVRNFPHNSTLLTPSVSCQNKTILYHIFIYINLSIIKCIFEGQRLSIGYKKAHKYS